MIELRALEPIGTAEAGYCTDEVCYPGVPATAAGAAGDAAGAATGEAASSADAPAEG